MLERLFGKKKKTQPQEQSETSAQASETSTQADPATKEEESRAAETTEQAPQAAPAPSAEGSQSSADPSPTGTDEKVPQAARELERAIEANAKHDSPDTRQKVYQELLFSDLLLALADPTDKTQAPPAKNGEEVKGKNISVAIMKNPSGMQFAAAFTGPEAAKRWRAEGGNFVSMKGRDVYKLLEPSPAEVIVINPGSAPFVVLPKVDYKQLALGVVPQNQHSPVQNPPAGGGKGGDAKAGAKQEGEGGQPQDGQMQVSFPPDVFSEEQKSLIQTILMVHTHVEAAVFGAIRPPNAKENEWIRTIFIRAINVKPQQEAVQALCAEIRDSILENEDLFRESPFEVGVMPDPQFWVAMHQNKIVLFDKNPPAVPQAAANTPKPEGVADAKVD